MKWLILFQGRSGFSVQKRFLLAKTLIILPFVILIGRLYFLQIIRGDTYRARSESNFIQERPIPHHRGIIFDRTERILVDNRPAHDLFVTFAMLPDSQKSLKQLAKRLPLTKDEISSLVKRIHDRAKKGNHEPIRLSHEVKSRNCELLSEFIQTEQLRGVEIFYPQAGFYQKCGVEIDAAEFPSEILAYQKLQAVLALPDDEMEQYWEAAKKKSIGLGRFKPVLFMADVGFDAYARVENSIALGALPGVAVFDSIKRRHVFGNLASHALGYVNEVSIADMTRLEGAYKSGDRIGRRGIEAVYESVLRGQDGVERFVVDAKGRRFADDWEEGLLGDDRVVPALPGHGLVLSLDYDLQKTAEESFMDKAGAVIAIDPKTGFILALASLPGIDPNLLGGRVSAKVLADLSTDPLKPWINKAIQDHYAPGSTFKAITAIAGLEHKILTPQFKRHCSGIFHLGRASWRCFNRDGDGWVNMIDALRSSCDVYFYHLGYELGPDRLAQTARLLGFGQKSGIDLDKEIPGIMPDKDYYKKRLGYYAPGLVVNSAIGQGDVTVTPIQLAVAYSAILNGGIVFKPQLVREIVGVHGETVEMIAPKIKAHLQENIDELRQVKESLAYVMQPGGTAYGLRWRQDLPELAKWLRESNIIIGGKTGTAQVRKLSKSIKHIDPNLVPYEERDHSWFVGFAPLDDPEIVVVAITIHGGYGATKSAPVVASVIKTWFEKARGVTNVAGR